jgi:hypothetical protein
MLLTGSHPLALVPPVLHGHLHGDFHGHGAGVAEEHVVQVARQEACQALGEAHGLRMVDPAEHDMRHLLQLVVHRPHQMRLVVTVAGGPPRRQSVDQPTPVFQHQVDILGSHDWQWHRRGLHLRVGHPHMTHARALPVRNRVRSLYLVWLAHRCIAVRDGRIQFA